LPGKSPIESRVIQPPVNRPFFRVRRVSFSFTCLHSGCLRLDYLSRTSRPYLPGIPVLTFRFDVLGRTRRSWMYACINLLGLDTVSVPLMPTHCTFTSTANFLAISPSSHDFLSRISSSPFPLVHAWLVLYLISPRLLNFLLSHLILICLTFSLANASCLASPEWSTIPPRCCEGADL
jgi:hypothetical protein